MSISIMSDRMDLNFLLNAENMKDDIKPSKPIVCTPALVVRSHPEVLQNNGWHSHPTITSHSPRSMYDNGIINRDDANSPVSSISEHSFSSPPRKKSTDYIFPPIKLERPSSAGSQPYSNHCYGLPPIKFEWPRPLPEQSMFLKFQDPPLQDHTILVDSRTAPDRPRWGSLQNPHQPSGDYDSCKKDGRRFSYPNTSPRSSHEQSNPRSGSSVTKRRTRKPSDKPHPNQKYPRPQVHWIRYMKEDCKKSYKVMAAGLWELQFPGSRPDISDQCLSSKNYRDNFVPLLGENDSLIFVDGGKIAMRPCKVRERETEHKGIPFTFVQKFPMQALMYDWVSEEHKVEARAIIDQDRLDPTTKAARVRHALNEMEAAIDPPSSTKKRSAANSRAKAATETTSAVLLIRNEAIWKACKCKIKDPDGEVTGTVAHDACCPARHHVALSMCNCPDVVTTRTRLHLPACKSLEYGKSTDIAKMDY